MNAFVQFLVILSMIFSIVIGVYFWNLLKSQHGSKSAVEKESQKELDKLRELRAISLSEPLSEKTRPSHFRDIVGQEDGLKALKAALFGPHPQHVLIYGPPGVGKTAAARVVLEEAKRSPNTPFRSDAVFLEIDATTARFDDRGIADPLMGSVHDPIYQGAGPLGVNGVPQPKPGAVTKAHGGILFLDEIGELHPIQMNRLLKVLEDRRVYLESAYYSPDNRNIPEHIHDIFQNGLPADFRLIGATTRSPEEISPALRSRCIEVFFRSLTTDEIWKITKNALDKVGAIYEEGVLDIVVQHALSGRDAVNMVQIAEGLAISERRNRIRKEDMEWVVNSGHYSPRPVVSVSDEKLVGVVNGLAIYGPHIGQVMEIEAKVYNVPKGESRLVVTGIIEEEEIGELYGQRLRRKSMARASLENALTVLGSVLNLELSRYHIHINFPGGAPVDGPSAGLALSALLYSAIQGIPVDNRFAFTGEVGVRGVVRPVGGVTSKIDAAIRAGIQKVYIPLANYQSYYANYPIEVVPILRVEEMLEDVFGTTNISKQTNSLVTSVNG
ncbi:MAG TPA: ATP-dependent protease LonB [Firmicutes bacterium]|jgi:Lon-like ATP-dependent protease|nr:ATP-dependent protease LonB [Bacillota bacterium]